MLWHVPEPRQCPYHCWPTCTIGSIYFFKKMMAGASGPHNLSTAFPLGKLSANYIAISADMALKVQPTSQKNYHRKNNGHFTKSHGSPRKKLSPITSDTIVHSTEWKHHTEKNEDDKYWLPYTWYDNALDTNPLSATKHTLKCRQVDVVGTTLICLGTVTKKNGCSITYFSLELHNTYIKKYVIWSRVEGNKGLIELIFDTDR